MCGNGIRCFSRYVVEEKYTSNKLKVETLAGIKELEVSVEDDVFWIKVNMGRPKFRSEEIPAKDVGCDLWKNMFSINGKDFDVYAVNTGVPHAVVFVDSLDFEIKAIARVIRYSELFPQGTNVNFVRVVSANEIEIRTYERGVEDETLSCGTGSVAAVAVANKLNLVSDSVKVMTKGGLLKIELKEAAYMTGSANRVFDGILTLSELKYET
jgi:diaminopimelate epimerase